MIPRRLAKNTSQQRWRRWAVAEGWTERLIAAQRKAAMLAVDKDAERLARMALRHRKGARAIQQVRPGPPDPRDGGDQPQTNRPYVITRADGTPGGFKFRPMLPSELNHAPLAFAKAADLEWGRAGGKATNSKTEEPSPDLVVLLNQVWTERERRRAEGLPIPPPPADGDPRLLRLKRDRLEGE